MVGLAGAHHLNTAPTQLLVGKGGLRLRLGLGAEHARRKATPAAGALWPGPQLGAAAGRAHSATLALCTSLLLWRASRRSSSSPPPPP